jgi:DNA-binding transcriptional LysR family regulator
MTLEQLRIFVAVAERQHVTQAAADLCLTQSAVSAAISALEARHDVRLFDRVGRNIVLNPTGALFLQQAKAVLAQVCAAEDALSDLSELKRGRLSIHASQTIASYWLPSRLVAFAAAYPGIRIDVAVGNTAEAAEAVAEGLAELGLVEGEIDDPALARQTLDFDHLVIVVGRGHAWTDRTEVTAAEFDQTDWVLRERGSGTRSAFEGALAAAGVDPGALRVALTLPANEALLAAVAAGGGATAVSARVAAPFLQSGAVRHVPFDLPTRSYHLLRHKARYRSKAADAFLLVARAL